MAVTDAWADWSTTAASNSPAGAATPEVDDELRNIKAQVKANAWTVANAATEAIQETGTSTTTIVTPGVQKYHPSATKAWLQCDMVGTIGKSFNIATLTDVDVGIITATFTVNFTTDAFPCVASIMNDTAVQITLRFSQAANTFQVRCYNTSFQLADPVRWHVICCGEQ